MGKFLLRISGFLQNRKFQESVYSDVPQSSVLGPLLIVMSLYARLTNYTSFADEGKPLLQSVRLQEDIQFVKTWSNLENAFKCRSFHNSTIMP